MLKMCLLRLLFKANVEEHSGQANGFFPSWTVSMCFFRDPFVENAEEQTGHANMQMVSCLREHRQCVSWEIVL